jgi:IS5 family transposase
MTKRRTYNTKPPAVHPKPFQSALWNHLEEIRQMRRARKMWAEIAAHLKEAHGLEVSYRTIRNFFIRTRSPNRRYPCRV